MARHVGGWIKLHRRIRESWVGKDAVAFAIFVNLLLDANTEDGVSPVDQGVLIRRGQVVTSDRELAKRLRIPRSTVQRKLDRMGWDKSGPMLGRGVGHLKGVITILNYEKYQGSDFDGGPPTGPKAGQDRAYMEEVVGVIEKNSFPSSPASLLSGARARVDPWREPAEAQREARRILAKTIGAPARAAAGENATDDDLWDEAGELAHAVIGVRYKSFRHFWGAYCEARSTASQTIVDGQFREEFAAILTDPEFKGPAAAADGAEAIQ